MVEMGMVPTKMVKQMNKIRMIALAVFLSITIFAVAKVYGAENNTLYAGVCGELADMYYENQNATLEAVVTDMLGSSEVDSTEYSVPEYNGMKSWMSYQNITNRSSKQWELQQYAWTDEYGLRRIGERYCIAIGTHFNAPIGQYVDLVLENGIMIKCIVSDIKANQHTDASNIFTSNHCCSEFLTSTGELDAKIKRSGDVSSKSPFWEDRVVKITVIDKNYLEERNENGN